MKKYESMRMGRTMNLGIRTPNRSSRRKETHICSIPEPVTSPGAMQVRNTVTTSGPDSRFNLGIGRFNFHRDNQRWIFRKSQFTQILTLQMKSHGLA